MQGLLTHLDSSSPSIIWTVLTSKNRAAGGVGGDDVLGQLGVGAGGGAVGGLDLLLKRWEAPWLRYSLRIQFIRWAKGWDQMNVHGGA